MGGFCPIGTYRYVRCGNLIELPIFVSRDVFSLSVPVPPVTTTNAVPYIGLDFGEIFPEIHATAAAAVASTTWHRDHVRTFLSTWRTLVRSKKISRGRLDCTTCTSGRR